jgi:hypothetical protein
MAYRTALAVVDGGIREDLKGGTTVRDGQLTYRWVHQLVRRALEAGWLHGGGIAGLRECLPKVENAASRDHPGGSLSVQAMQNLVLDR